MAKIAKRAKSTVKNLLNKVKKVKKKSDLKKAVTTKARVITSGISVAKNKMGKKLTSKISKKLTSKISKKVTTKMSKKLSPKKPLLPQRGPAARKKIKSLLKVK